jgi:hypothetical protein
MKEIEVNANIPICIENFDALSKKYKPVLYISIYIYIYNKFIERFQRLNTYTMRTRGGLFLRMYLCARRLPRRCYYCLGLWRF